MTIDFRVRTKRLFQKSLLLTPRYTFIRAGFDPDPRDATMASIKAHEMTLDDFVLQIVRNSIH